MLNPLKFAFVLFAALLLAACGGGGGTSGASAPVVVAAPSFPLQSAYKAYLAGADTINFSVSGTCSGSAIIIQPAPVAAIFEGFAALASSGTSTINLTNCTPSSIVSTVIQYYDSNYNALGHLNPGTEYGKYLSLPGPLPVSVKVGDSGTYGTETLYSDSSKTTVTGQDVDTYVVEPDGTSSTTAIVNLITKNFNPPNQLLSTTQARYRIDASGTLSVVSLDQQGGTTGSTHLIFTRR